MKRFYKTAEIAPASGPKGFNIMLDGKPVRTPEGNYLLVPDESLASAVAMEWKEQTDTIKPYAMPLTQILTTAQEHVPRDRNSMEKAVLAYLNTDLVCYRTSLPAPLRLKQEQMWNPWIEWFQKRFGSTLETTDTLTALEQPSEAHETVRNFIAALDDLRFTLLQIATSSTGSIVLALAFIEREISTEAIFNAVRIDEIHKAKIYRDQFEDSDLRRDLHAIAQMLDLLPLKTF